MHKWLADLSRLLSRITGGEAGTTLCKRAAVKWGPDCGFCRLVGFVLRQPTHCLEEMTGRGIAAWIKRRK